MTPHCHWFVLYSPCNIPICLANDEVIRAAGVGTVEFKPVKDGCHLQPVVFSQVLHVPSIAKNLLSVLALTHHHGFTVTIPQGHMDFKCGQTLHFTATIQGNNVAYWDGRTTSQETAHSVQVPKDLELWHC